MTPAALCAACLAPLYPRLARVTDAGWTCAEDPLCEAITHRLAATKEAAMPHANQHQSVTWEEEQAILDLYRDGASLNATARASGRSRSAVTRILRENGVAQRPASAYAKPLAADTKAKISAAVISNKRDQLAYKGGWVRVAGVLRPTQPMRGRAA